MKWIVFTTLVICSSVFAGPISFDQIFSKDSPKGGLLCHEFENDEKGQIVPVSVFTEPQLNKETTSKKKLLTADTGDACFVLYFEEKKNFFKVKDEDNNLVWIKLSPKNKKKILDLATQNSPGEIRFKDESLKVFTNSKFKVTMKAKDIFKNKKIPSYLYDLKIKLPFPDKINPNSSIQFWRSTTPKSKPETLKVPEVYTYVTSEVGGATDWDVKVVDKEGDKLLVAYDAKMANTNIASDTSESLDSPSFSWIKLNDIETERTKRPQGTSPLFLKNQVIYSGNEKIGGKEYSRFRVIQLIANPKRAHKPKYPETIAINHLELREVWVPTYDKQGGVNFWLYTVQED